MDYNRGPRNKSTQLQASNLDKGVKSLHREKNSILINGAGKNLVLHVDK